MKIRIISIGKLKKQYLKSGEEDYLKRLSSQCKISIEEVNSDKFSALPKNQLVEKEAELVLNKIDNKEYFIVLDENGKSFNSVDFSKLISSKISFGISNFAFAIGGAYGWHDKVRTKADLVLSLSDMTFPYQLTRLILIEQLYRAMSIMSGSPYHNE